MVMDAGIATLYGAAMGAGAALFGGIIAGIFALLANRMNHRADIQKIAYERRLESFREIYEKMCHLSSDVAYQIDFAKNFVNGKLHEKDEDEIHQYIGKLFDKASKTGHNIIDLKDKYTLILPKQIINQIEVFIENSMEVVSEIPKYIRKEKDNAMEQNFITMLRKQHEVLSEMQKFIGVK
jgi:hypothetical protein